MNIKEQAYELQNKYPAGISPEQLQREIPDCAKRAMVYDRLVWLYADKTGKVFGD